jgi:hypothetical protein
MMLRERKLGWAGRVRRTARSAWPVLLFCGAGAGCEFIASVDKSGLGVTGSAGSSGLGGMVLGVGGTSGAGGTPDDDASVGGDPGTGGTNDTGGSSGSGGGAGSGTGGGNGGSSGGSSGAGGILSDAAPSDAPGDSPSIPIDASACVRAIPAGWTLTAFNPAAASCPTGFTDHAIYSGTATIGSTACTCGCNVTPCQGTLTVLIAPGQGTDTCTVGYVSGAATDGSNCIAAATPRVEAAQATFASTSGGQCTNTTMVNSAQLMKPTAQHYCDVPTASSDAVCNGTAPAGYSACIISSGSPACPAPFTAATYHVEDDITLNCSNCTGCAVTGSCSTGTANLFGGTNCAAPSLGAIPVNNNACVVVNGGSEVAVGSVNYTPTPALQCTVGTSNASTATVGPRTICCR